MTRILHPVFGGVDIEDLEPKQLLSVFIQWSFLYYVRMESVVDDSVYDAAAKILLDRWDEWQSHPHSGMVTKADLTAGTLYTLTYKDYPTIVVATSEDWIRPEWAEIYRRDDGRNM